MLVSKKFFTHIYGISRPSLYFISVTQVTHLNGQPALNYSCKSSDDSSKKGKSCVYQGKKDDTNVCKLKNTEQICKVGKQAVAPIPKECKTKTPVVYDPNCPRPYVNPCVPQYSKPCIPGYATPHPCQRSNRKKKKTDMECVYDPDCPHARKMPIGLRIKQIILAAGSLIMGYLLYKNWFLTEKEEKGGPVAGSTRQKKKRTREVAKNPAGSSEIPSEVPYLLIGGGTASSSASRAIRSIDPQAKVLIITKEPFNPYMRPPLNTVMLYPENEGAADTLSFAAPNGAQVSVFLEPPEFYISCGELNKSPNGGVAVAKGWSVTKLDVKNHEAVLEDGKKIKYQKCLIATGSTPKTLDVFDEASDEVKKKITTFRDIFDMQMISDTVTSGIEEVVIIGGGFLGSELACALAKRKELKITNILKESGNMEKILPRYLSQWTKENIEAQGVRIIPNTLVDDVSMEDNKLKIMLTNEESVTADLAVVAIGVEPNIELADVANLEIDSSLGGYLVNTELQARTDLYVAGDCASFHDVKLGRRRVEHHSCAALTGRLAGENMAGNTACYDTQSVFFSGLGSGIGYEAIGLVDSRLPTVGVFAKKDDDKGGDLRINTPDGDSLANDDFSKGVIFYLKDDIVVGVILWNLENKSQIAKLIIDTKTKYDDLNDVAKLLNIHGGKNV